MRMNSQMKRYIGKVWKSSQYQNFCLHGVGVHHPIPTQELPEASTLGIVLEASSPRNDG